MNKKKIKLRSPELMTEFVNICTSYDNDINLYDGMSVVDAKSLIGVFNVSLGKILEVQIITNDESVISSFIEDMRKFEV